MTSALVSLTWGAGEGEEVFDDFFAPEPFVLDDLEGFVNLGQGLRLFQEVFGESQDHGHGIIDLMGHPGGQGADGGQLLHVDHPVFNGLAAGDVPGDDLVGEGFAVFIFDAHDAGGKPEFLVADGHPVALAPDPARFLDFPEPFQVEVGRFLAEDIIEGAADEILGSPLDDAAEVAGLTDDRAVAKRLAA